MPQQNLVFFTMNYPYGKGETFIEDEISYLSENFKEIIIFPLRGKGDMRPVPHNCKVIKPIYSSDTDLLIKGVFCLAPIFYFICHFFKENGTSSFRKTLKYIATTILCRAILTNKKFRQVNESSVHDIMYFYWGIGFAYILPFIKNKNCKVVRFHRTDLYVELRKNKYIPFRESVYSNLTKAVFISQQGLDYARKTWPTIPFTACLSYLGTQDNGINIPVNDNKIHILSCSNVIKVKRVDLILEALLLCHKYDIIWTHIGDGAEFKSLQERIQNIPQNLTVKLIGHLSHPKVIEYYQNNPTNIFINVSSSEGLPVSIMEAISFNVPVIATNVGGTSEIVNKDTGILIEPMFTADELANRIIELYERRSNYRPREFWEQHFEANRNYTYFVKNILKQA